MFTTNNEIKGYVWYDPSVEYGPENIRSWCEDENYTDCTYYFCNRENLWADSQCVSAF